MARIEQDKKSGGYVKARKANPPSSPHERAREKGWQRNGGRGMGEEV
jgi:hypothetical protein